MSFVGSCEFDYKKEAYYISDDWVQLMKITVRWWNLLDKEILKLNDRIWLFILNLFLSK